MSVYFSLHKYINAHMHIMPGEIMSNHGDAMHNNTQYIACIRDHFIYTGMHMQLHACYNKVQKASYCSVTCHARI